MLLPPNRFCTERIVGSLWEISHLSKSCRITVKWVMAPAIDRSGPRADFRANDAGDFASAVGGQESRTTEHQSGCLLTLRSWIKKHDPWCAANGRWPRWPRGPGFLANSVIRGPRAYSLCNRGRDQFTLTRTPRTAHRGADFAPPWPARASWWQVGHPLVISRPVIFASSL
jgi:hypothetical protein